jgi:hypothetical protein
MKTTTQKIFMSLMALFSAAIMYAQAPACDCTDHQKLAGDSATAHFHPRPPAGTRIKTGLNDQCNPNSSGGCKGWCGFRFILGCDTVFVSVDCGTGKVTKIIERDCRGNKKVFDYTTTTTNDKLTIEDIIGGNYYDIDEYVVVAPLNKIGNKPDEKLLQSDNATMMSVFPNPITEGQSFSISLNNNLGTTLLEVVDVYGRPVKQLILNNSGTNTIIVETTGMSAGIYFVTGKKNGITIMSEKLVIFK